MWFYFGVAGSFFVVCFGVADDFLVVCFGVAGSFLWLALAQRVVVGA